MENRRLGNTDVCLSLVGLGCWPMGGAEWGGADDEASVRTVHRALGLGVTFFDTAEAYGWGHSEEVLGRALKGHRAEAVIATKAYKTHLAPAALREALRESMLRIGTDYIDLYFIHWPDPEQPIGETMAVLEDLRREGQIRAIGVSNFSLELLQQAMEYGTVDALQPPYNMIWRFIERDLLPFCREHGVGVTTYSSLAQGILTGTLSLESSFPEGDVRPNSVLFQPERYGKCLEMVEGLRPIAKGLDVTVAQLALRWVIEQPGVITSLVGARQPEEIAENVGAVGWDLPSDALAEMQALSDGLFGQFDYFPDMWFNWLKRR